MGQAWTPGHALSCPQRGLQPASAIRRLVFKSPSPVLRDMLISVSYDDVSSWKQSACASRLQRLHPLPSLLGERVTSPCFTSEGRGPGREGRAAAGWVLGSQAPRSDHSSRSSPTRPCAHGQLLRPRRVLAEGQVTQFSESAVQPLPRVKVKNSEERQLGSLARFPNISIAAVYLRRPMAMVRIPNWGVENSA